MDVGTFIRKSTKAMREGRTRQAAADFFNTEMYRFGAAYRAWKFDRVYGVDTRAKQLGLRRNRAVLSRTINSPNEPQNTGFGPSDPIFLTGILESLPIRYQDYTFIDLGAGTGRILLMASEFPFRKITGVEFCPPLCEKALENSRRYKSASQKCRNFEVLCMDASEYRFPDEPLVVFLSNPFRAEALLRKILENVKSSLMDNPRQIYVIYSVPVLSRVVQACSFLEKIGDNYYCQVYRNTLWQGKMQDIVASEAASV